jgi:hypothetical protein
MGHENVFTPTQKMLKYGFLNSRLYFLAKRKYKKGCQVKYSQAYPKGNRLLSAL